MSTAGWANGTYLLTASYAGTSNCGASTSTASIAVTSAASPGQLALGYGSYTPVPALGTTSFGFVVAQVPHSAGTYAGELTLVTPGKWWFQANVTSFGLAGPTQGLLAGKGSLYWWNATLNKGHGGWHDQGPGCSPRSQNSPAMRRSAWRAREARRCSSGACCAQAG
ncbi:MAG TPA: hypothetical protein VI365_00400 [Trebonia sp.]